MLEEPNLEMGVKVIATAIKTILLVEPDAVRAKDAQAALTGLGYAVPVVVSSIEEALKELQRVRPDLIIIAAELNGDADRMRVRLQSSKELNIPSIYLAARSDAKTLQLQEHILYPFREEELKSALETAIYSHRMKETLSETATEVLCKVGNDFFRSLAQCLVKMLGADQAFIGELAGGKEKIIRTIALCVDGQIVDNAEFELANSAGESAPSNRLCVYDRGVLRQFPSDQFLADMGAGSYTGISLWNSAGRPLGIMAAMARRPFNDEKQAEALLQLFAARVSAELERRQDLEYLRRSEERYRTILEEIRDGYYEVDAEGNLVYFNKSFCEIYGYEEEELQGSSFRRFLNPDTAIAVQQAFDRVYETQWPERSFAYDIIRKNGDTFHVEASATLVKDGRGRPCGLRGIVRNVTERKRAEELLKRSEERYRSLFERNLSGVFHSTLNGHILDCNDSFARMFGYASRKEVLAAGAWELYFREEDRKSYIAFLQMHGSLTNYEMCLRRKDGGPVWVLGNVNLIKGKDDESTVLEGVLNDISERKQAEEQLRESREWLRDLMKREQSVREEERIRIARAIHDELGQALTSLKLDLSWMTTRLPKESENLLDRIVSMSELIDTTIETVQRISLDLRPRILDDLGLAAALEWQVQEFQSRTGINCLFIANPENLTLDQDRSTTLFRVFQECLTNIARHAEATEVNILLKQDADFIVLEIEDNGRGIPESKIGNYQSLGLMGMQERALIWGGSVKIHSVEGRGTNVTTRLPAEIL